MKNYIESGDTLTLPAAAAAYTAGAPALVGNGLLGVPANTTAIGDDAVLRLRGVFAIAKAASVTPAAGDKAYWDDTNKVVTNITTGNTLCGRFWNAPLAGDATVNVRISPVN